MVEMANEFKGKRLSQMFFRSVSNSKALRLLMPLILTLALSFVSFATDNCDLSIDVTCFTASELSYGSLWAKMPALTPKVFSGSIVFARKAHYDQIRTYILDSGGLSYSAYNSTYTSRVTNSPTISTYAPWDGSHTVASTPFWWPVSKTDVDKLLATEPAVAIIGSVDGQPRLLLAARTASELTQLIDSTLGGYKPDITASAVQPWAKVVTTSPEWAAFTVVVDLRHPVYDGTAVVYFQVRGCPNCSEIQMLVPREWRSSPSDLVAVYDPETGAVNSVPETRPNGIPLDNEGRVVYEAKPYFYASGIKSLVLPDHAFIHLSSLFPVWKHQSEYIAVRWLTPSDWQVHCPWEQVDGWHRVPGAELYNFVTLGNLSISNFIIDYITYSVAQRGDTSAEVKRHWDDYIQSTLSKLVDWFGSPPTSSGRRFTISLLDSELGGGFSGPCTVIVDAREKVIAHELIHWWTWPSQIGNWLEGATEYLAFRVLRDTGFWSQSDYEANLASIGAVKAVYPRLSAVSDPYGGDSIAFMRDLDLYIQKESGGIADLITVVRYFNNNPIWSSSRYTSLEMQLNLTLEATGVDVRPFFDQRY